MAYNRVNWEDAPSTATPLNSTNLNNMDAYIAYLDNAVSDQKNTITDVSNELELLNVRMDSFINLPDGSTTGDAELADARIGEDGTNYNTAGDAIRAQVAARLKPDVIAEAFDPETDYEVGDFCTHDHGFYLCVTAITGAAGSSWDSSKWEDVTVGNALKELKEALTDLSATLTHKADVDGTVASAEQLLSDVGTEDKAPYLFRVTPYDSTRVDEEIVGCSVGWNQLALDIIKSLSHTWDADGSYYYTLTNNSGINMEVGHVYFAGAKITRTISGNNFLGLSVTPVIFLVLENEEPNGYAYQIAKVTSAITDSYIRFNNYSGKRGFNAGDSAEYDDLMVIDLTAWFGSTIADYAYTLEQATAGSGVAWIKQFLPGGYIPYSAPTLKSVSGLSAHVMRGFNQWDEEWEVGGISLSTGEKTVDNDRIRTKNRNPIIPDAQYYLKLPYPSTLRIYFYDADGNYLVDETMTGVAREIITVPANACYYMFIIYNAGYGTTYKNDICINLSDPARNGQYEPYKATTYALDSELTLRGILKMDSAHTVYADGDVYLGEGKKNERYAEVDLGTLGWSYNTAVGDNKEYVASVTGKAYGTTNMICSGFVTKSTAELNCIRGRDSSNSVSVVSTQNDVASFKASVSGLYLVYEKATPTTETAAPYASPQNCAVGGTEEYVYGENGSGVVVGHNSKYQKNLKGELERVSVAVPEVGSTAGTYTLKATVTAQGVTYAWVAE